MRIVLLGKNGQVGHELQRALLPLGEVLAFGRDECDLASPASLEAVLRDAAPQVIVNAAAYTAVDKAESDQDTARLVNADAVGVLADYCASTGALLVHYSTDYVFDGEKSNAYIESDAPNPQSVYGATKLAGESAIIKSGCPALVFRTSWVYSTHGGNFLKTMLRLARERDALNVVADQHGTPTGAELIADVTLLAIAAHRKGDLPSGIYHLTASGSTSWHAFARHIIGRALHNGAQLKLTADDVHAIGTADYPTAARRPRNSTLDATALSQALGLQLPDWRVHADRVIDQLTKLETLK
ncbi:dTDP-4-dehydrorhamnose reductase [Achromobacter sp. MFA1 R4]|uniref:dTDP-4-dehydrorhamnose reductase n=1 Tax=Achromobacter sp. MFA1 R4 TaxID=1881016 RepID=UPI0009538C8B|nr:dTDP-4-dehydrorhamnose reductase [Achromobacter sp. MFA1 R4]SIT21109.1 dTDP-4-dehydrorhamnose reductase [Achromobacter sp. MFA1 R4]